VAVAATRNPWPCGRVRGWQPWPQPVAVAGGRSSQPGRPASRCRQRQPATVADHFGSITAMIASRHPVTASKFRVSILEFVFNPEILARKQFGLRENGQTNFGKPF